MATLPPSTDITSGTATEGNAKTWFSAVRTYIAQQLGENGTQHESLAALGVPFNGSVVKNGAYTVVAGDRGKVLTCSGTFTLSLTAAATLADGFCFAVWNNGVGVITIDPNLSELIDSSITKTVDAGKFALIYCNGTSFATVGSIATGSGSGLDADLLDGQHGSYYAPATGGNYVAKDHGHNNVGSFCLAQQQNSSTYTAGSTIAGSSLIPSGNAPSGPIITDSSSLSGTWRCLGYTTGAGNNYGHTLWQRIA